MKRRVLITGGAGFIGSAFVRYLVRETEAAILNVDKLTYAGNLQSLADVAGDARYAFVQADIADAPRIATVFREFAPDMVVHLAAESHVDRSIDAPAAFINTNIIGTFVMLETALDYWRGLTSERQDAFRFHHVSTDEVFGTAEETAVFGATSRYDPSSPYAASKAASDHLVRAWQRTFGLPVVLSNCGNNYGPYQFPEKLIPLMILKALKGEPMPVYGTGENIRDWVFVEDHARALWTIGTRGAVGATYLVGGGEQRRNVDVVRSICRIVDEVAPHKDGARERLITFVADRPGHDPRYALDPSPIGRDLGWTPRETFETGLRRTVAWYFANRTWWEPLLYRGERLGALR